MELKDKDLLLQDLCARLPYKVKAQIPDEYGGYTSAIESIDIDGFVTDFEGTQIEIECIKPYLFPLSSMTEEESNEFQQLDTECDKMPTFDYISIEHYRIFDWLNKNHFDYRGFIEKGLAIDCTNLNIY